MPYYLSSSIIRRLPAFSRLSFWLLFLVAGVNAQNKLPTPLPLRTLIISGGPTVDSNQYAIESNARYVEKLTAPGRSQRILFADGKRASRSISTVEPIPDEKEATVLAWLLDEDWPANKLVLRAPTLKRLDGGATNANIIRETRSLAASVQSGEHGLIYFTGHGLPNTKMLFLPDYQNTVYSSWGDGKLAVRTLAPALQSWPQDVPLTLVMVQCHSGGFANLIFQDGDPTKGIWPRDFCGFFSSLGELMSAGCTPEVDERNYQDFTTHFFAALSGVARDGRRVSGADYDKNGVVSGLEALAYTHLHDNSIDVPVCTSDVYLRSLWEENGHDWMKVPFSTVLKTAEKWQEAVLLGLSRELRLEGETRITDAFHAYQKLDARTRKGAATGRSYGAGNYGDASSLKMNQPDTSKLFYALEQELLRRFPALKSKQSRAYAVAKQKAIAFLKTRPAQVAKLHAAAVELDWEWASAGAENRQAKLMRLVRMARTVVLQERLSKQGMAEQKAVFARLRAAEIRNLLQ